jgi:hypothetical protein
MVRAIRLLIVTIVASGLASVGLAGGCYSPAVQSCQYACAGTQALCPAGLVCNTQRMCVSQVSERCMTADAGPIADVAMPDMGPPDVMSLPDAGSAPD